MKLQDWQKQILKMTEGQKLAPIFTTKNKNTTKMKKQFKTQLKNLIIENGYWSTMVYDFNNLWQNKIGYTLWMRWHDEVKSELRKY